MGWIETTPQAARVDGSSDSVPAVNVYAFRSVCSARRFEPIAASNVAAVKRVGSAVVCHESAERRTLSDFAADKQHAARTLAGGGGASSSASASGDCVLGSPARNCASLGSSRAACSLGLSRKRHGNCECSALRAKHAPRQHLPRWRSAPDAGCPRCRAARVLWLR